MISIEELINSDEYKSDKYENITCLSQIVKIIFKDICIYFEQHNIPKIKSSYIHFYNKMYNHIITQSNIYTSIDSIELNPYNFKCKELFFGHIHTSVRLLLCLQLKQEIINTVKPVNLYPLEICTPKCTFILNQSILRFYFFNKK